MKAIPTLKDHGYNRVEFAMSIRQWAEEAEQENNEIIKQAAHWHEAYAKSEAVNALLKAALEEIGDHLVGEGGDSWKMRKIAIKALEE